MPRGERVSALLALGSAVGVLAFFVSSLTPGGGGGEASFEVEPSSRTVAPGGRIVLTGSDAPDSSSLVLETRAKGGPWREAGRAESGSDGDFRLEGRWSGALGRSRYARGFPGRPRRPRCA